MFLGPPAYLFVTWLDATDRPTCERGIPAVITSTPAHFPPQPRFEGERVSEREREVAGAKITNSTRLGFGPLKNLEEYWQIGK